MPDADPQPPAAIDPHAIGIDPAVPHIARIYDFHLGGTNNFAADRQAGQAIVAKVPEAIETAREHRGFLQRAVRFMAQEGIRQFIDVGTGLPTQGNVHQVTQQVAPDSRVVYVDNDPIVLAHSRALLTGTRRAVAILADFRRADEILRHPDLQKLIDLGEPAGALLCGLLHFIPDEDDPYGSVAYLRDALAPGSYVAIATVCEDYSKSRDVERFVKKVYVTARSTLVGRERDEIVKFFDGLDLVEPGLVWAPEWRPGPGGPGDDPSRTHVLVGVGRKR